LLYKYFLIMKALSFILTHTIFTFINFFQTIGREPINFTSFNEMMWDKNFFARIEGHFSRWIVVLEIRKTVNSTINKPVLS